MQEKEVTIYDLALKLILSPAILRRGLIDNVASKKPRKKIFDLANEMGCRSHYFASNLRSQKTNTIVVMVPRRNCHFNSTSIASIEIIANDEDLNRIIIYLDETAEHHLNSHFKGNPIIQYTNQIILHTELLIRASSNRQMVAQQTEKIL